MLGLSRKQISYAKQEYPALEHANEHVASRAQITNAQNLCEPACFDKPEIEQAQDRQPMTDHGNGGVMIRSQTDAETETKCEDGCGVALLIKGLPQGAAVECDFAMADQAGRQEKRERRKDDDPQNQGAGIVVDEVRQAMMAGDDQVRLSKCGHDRMG